MIFRDRCGQTFVRYEGAWRLSSEDGHTVITYELTAEPSFDVPGVILKRLLRRDSARMIVSLQREIAARGLLALLPGNSLNSHVFRHRVERKAMAPREIGHPGPVRTRKLTEHAPRRAMAQRKECLVQHSIQMLTHEGEYYWLDYRKSKHA